MILLEERLETAWRKSREQRRFLPAYPINVPRDFIDGYLAGCNEALASQWTNIKDGLPTLNADCIVGYTDRHGAYPCFCVASFCTGNQEWYSADDNLNRRGIKRWMYIPAPLSTPPPPKSYTNEKSETSCEPPV